MGKFSDMFHMLIQTEGSIIPFAAMVALPCGALSTLLKVLEANRILGFHILFDLFKINGAAYGTFSSLLGFLVVFRTSQAYSRYWVGGGLMQQMTGSWFDAACSIFAFCTMSKAGAEEVKRFQHLLVRLFSLLNATALMELEGGDDEESQEEYFSRIARLETIDIDGLDATTLKAIRQTKHKIELIYHWIQVTIVDAIGRGVLNIAPPILTRAFMELADGMVKFHDCMKISLLPFPFPYSQATLILLIFHWLLTPFVMCTWTEKPTLAGLFSFLVVFIFWGLYAIAGELENPFGDDPNDLDAVEVQNEMNEKLMLLLSSVASDVTPAIKNHLTLEECDGQAIRERAKLNTVWDAHQRKTLHFTRRGTTSYLNLGADFGRGTDGFGI